MTSPGYASWGIPQARQTGLVLDDIAAPLPLAGIDGRTVLPFGNGRSYGDSCHNDGGVLLDCRRLDRILSFDTVAGVMRCEAGVLLSQIIERALPQGWFPAVTPGTQYVTVGGAIANDVHGKNHHRVGTFGRWVEAFEVLRSDGRRHVCDRTSHADLFAATIGGLGLTGLITWADLRLRRVAGADIEQEVVRFSGLDELFALAGESDAGHEYTVAWVDSLARGPAFGRGLYMRANHAEAAGGRGPVRRRRLAVPFAPPFPLISRASLCLFNALYYRRPAGRRGRSIVPFASFFYPLDAVAGWNRLYGPRGILQHQCVVPRGDAAAVLGEMLMRSRRAGFGSFLTVIKVFGDVPSPALLSFPRPGVTMTLDFPDAGPSAHALMAELDGLTAAAGGAVYPCKHSRMRREHFRAFYPRWRELERRRDPRFMSNLWRRVGEDR